MQATNDIRIHNEVRMIFIGSIDSGNTNYFNQFNNFVNELPYDNSIFIYKQIVSPKHGAITCISSDFSSNEEYAPILRVLVRKTHCLVFLYAIDDRRSFETLEEVWIPIY